MRTSLWIALAAGLCATGSIGAFAGPLVAHRAAYDVTLAEPFAQIGSGQSQSAVGARGLIGYEFLGSSCEGYTSKFRLAAQIEQSESDPVSLAQRSLTFEEPNSAGFRFDIQDKSGDDASTVAGYATRGDAGAMSVDLKKPSAGHADLGKDILFPTEHISRLLTEAEAGHTELEARVYDGSDSGKKVYQTLSIIGKKQPADDSTVAKLLAGHSRWPVTISYFDAAAKDAGVEYVMAFDLYDNGVTGDLKIDYGTFAIAGKLASLEFLPQGPCKK
jgi:EipB-like